jgi:hypothetical protein
MSTAEATELTDILNRVTTWPTTLRITLARKILESVDKAEGPTESLTPKMRGLSAAEVRGLVKTGPSADADIVKPLGTIETHSASPQPRKGSLKDLLGILKTDAPPPNDDECQTILEEELIKKYLK